MKTFHVVSHTHWDREWYQPFEVFRHRLVDLMDHLLEIFNGYPDFVFELDAQTVCLEDYLEIRPHRREEVERRIRSGNLIVGPWYVQNDFFLTDGESTVRNLLIGTEIARRSGSCNFCGYMPDQFGIAGQLPQILRGFGIDKAVFGRGYRKPDEQKPNEFEWYSPDGSSVFTSFLSRWYNNAQRFPSDPEKLMLFFRELEAAQENEAVTPHRLLMNGVDHLEAQENLLPVLLELNRRIAPDTIRQSTLCSALDAMREYIKRNHLPVHREYGEMRFGSTPLILSGTLSSRMPLKRENVRCEVLIEWRLEPLYILLEMLSGDELYDRDYFRHLWKTLLLNHPHDSICSCSTDRVHQDNTNRFVRVVDLIGEMTERGIRHFWARLDRSGEKASDYLVAVFNPLPRSRSGIASVRVFLPSVENPDAIHLTDQAGNPVRFAVKSAEARFQNNYSPINLPGQIPSVCAELEIIAEDVPACGYRVYRLGIGGESPLRPQTAELPACLENRYLRLHVSSEGKVSLLDKTGGELFEDLLTFTDECDIGHSYNFQAEPEGGIRDIGKTSRVQVQAFSRGMRRVVRTTYEFESPCGFDFSSKKRSAENVTNRITAEYSLDEFSHGVQVSVTMENHSGEHRIRAVFNPGIHAEETFASAPFGFERCCRKEQLRQKDRNADFPNSGVVVIDDGRRQFSCLNEGLFEYEHLEDGRIALTLLRCTGYIHGVEYVNGGLVLPDAEWCVPEGNLKGTHECRFAMRPGRGAFADLEQERQNFLAPLLTAFDSADPHKLTGGRPCDQCSAVRELFFRDLPLEKQHLPFENSALELDGRVVFSALKKAEDGSGSILRICNPEKETVSVKLRLPENFEALEVRLDETGCLQSFSGTAIELPVAPAKVLSLKLRKKTVKH